jgi:hypothetical protein
MKLEVGRPPSRHSSAPLRVLTADDFSESEKEELLTLARIGESWIRGPVRKDFQDATSAMVPAVEIRFDNIVAPALAENGANQSAAWRGDPYIKVHYSHEDRDYLVEGTMILAGVVASRWCSDRGMPAPYRSTSDPHQTELMKQLLEEDIYPKLERGARLDEVPLERLSSLYGRGMLSADPRPHAMMGLDMYAKATSPLRRFGDLVLHWQIHAALAEERRLGRPLQPEDCISSPPSSSSATFLPFPREVLGRTLTELQDREAIHKLLSNRVGPSQWIRQALVRAWQFGEGGGVPDRIVFTARVAPQLSPQAQQAKQAGARPATLVAGTIDWFDQTAFMNVDMLDGLMLTTEVRDGDRFEVEIDEIDVFEPRIRVRALRRLPSE